MVDTSSTFYFGREGLGDSMVDLDTKATVPWFVVHDEF
jgi:hypothetical protein